MPQDKKEILQGASILIMLVFVYIAAFGYTVLAKHKQGQTYVNFSDF